MKSANIFVGLLTVLVLPFALLGCDGFSNAKKSDALTRQATPGPVSNNPFPEGSPYERPNEGAFSEDKMLVNIGVNLVQRDIRNFKVKTANLLNEVSNTCQFAAGSAGFASGWSNTQSAWKDAMLAFHTIDAAAFGPLVENKEVIRSQIYAWPYNSPCDIDLEVEALASGQQRAVETFEINSRGLGALEYLLFTPSETSACNLRAHPQMKVWNEKALGDKQKDRCLMAEGIAQNLFEKAQYLDQRWDLNQGNFSKTLVDRGAAYPEVKTATQELMYGLFSFEKLKDERLAKPLGLSSLCLSPDLKCPQYAEHALSGLALPAIRKQAEGYQAAFFGARDPSAEGFGFDDYLIAGGHQDTVDKMKADFVTLFKTLDEIEATPGTLQEKIAAMDGTACRATTLENRVVPLCALYYDVRELTTVLKVEVLTALSLSAPAGYQGDND